MILNKYDIVSFLDDEYCDRYEVTDAPDVCRVKGYVLLTSIVSGIELYTNPLELRKHYIESIQHNMDLERDGGLHDSIS